MICRPSIARILAAAVAGVAALTVIGATVSPGPALAMTVAPLERCWGISPNIVDQPFSTARLFVYPTGPGRVRAEVNDISTFWTATGGYESVGRLDWHNLDNGRRGTAVDRAGIGLYVGGPKFDLNTGRGNVRVTLSAVNRNALWAIPTTSCSGTLRVG